VEEKRRQVEDNDGVIFGRVREDTVTEDEVEEFFAILKRIHVVVSYFRKVDGNGGRMTTQEGSRRLRAILERESDADDNGVKGKGKRGEEGVVEVKVGFDLNADPIPECDPL
jgi:hypothetical protein